MEKEKCQLFLLHFAGGSVYSFDFLRRDLQAYLDFIPLELPGRGKRLNEAFLKDKASAIKDYSNQIKGLRNNQPYLIYGHSMGATLGLSVAKQMEDQGDSAAHLIVSGNPGPDAKKMQRKKGHRYLMNDEDFKEELKKFGGVPKEVIENEGLYSFLSLILRADFELLERDDFSEKDIMLKTPIHALMGSGEKAHTEIGNWKRFTQYPIQTQILQGGHFFIREHPKEITTLIKQELKRIESLMNRKM